MYCSAEPDSSAIDDEGSAIDDEGSAIDDEGSAIDDEGSAIDDATVDDQKAYDTAVKRSIADHYKSTGSLMRSTIDEVKYELLTDPASTKAKFPGPLLVMAEEEIIMDYLWPS